MNIGQARLDRVRELLGSSSETGSARVVNVDALGDQIAELAAHIDAATYRLLTLLYEFDERDGWHTGFRTCAHWLSWRTGMDLGAARERMRVARALHSLPQLSDAMRRGVLSYSKARALTRIATPANESELLDLAMHGTAAHIERVVRAWRTVDRLEDAELEQQRHERLELSLFLDDDGSYVLRGRLDPETGALLERALEMAREELYGRQAGSSYGQELADAIGLVAELALQRGTADESGSDVTTNTGGAVSGTRAERFQVVVHVGTTSSSATLTASEYAKLRCKILYAAMLYNVCGSTTAARVSRSTRTPRPCGTVVGWTCTWRCSC